MTPIMSTDQKNLTHPKKRPKTVRLSENEAQKHQKRPKNAKNAIFFQDVSRFFLKIVLNHLYICILKGYK